ncbi:MAG: hypothetical protein ACYTGH_14165 [Planctomycetota bacterium]|jgi:hypothetical protein
MARDLDADEVRLRVDADDLLDRQGLRAVLAEAGHVEPAGSYLMRCMGTRVLDLYLQVEPLLEEPFFALGGRLSSHLVPLSMTFRNSRLNAAVNEPRGLQWHVFLGEPESLGAWQVRVTAMERYEYDDRMGFTIQLHDRMSPAHRLHILAILAQRNRSLEMRNRISNTEVWRAVIDRGVTDFQDFCELKGISSPL